MERIDNFERPTQVKFWDADLGHYLGGIGYNDTIICGCCGSIIELEDIYDWCEDVQDSDEENLEVYEGPIIVFDTWIGIDEAIIGE